MIKCASEKCAATRVYLTATFSPQRYRFILNVEHFSTPLNDLSLSARQ